MQPLVSANQSLLLRMKLHPFRSKVWSIVDSSHQLNLLDSLNKTNEKFEQYIIENENKAEEVEQELKKKLMFA